MCDVHIGRIYKIYTKIYTMNQRSLGSTDEQRVHGVHVQGSLKSTAEVKTSLRRPKGSLPF